jgi:hypothetical protein
MAQGLGMGVFFQKRKTRWAMRGGSNNATPFCMRFPKRSSLLKKDPHVQTSLNRMFHRAKVLQNPTPGFPIWAVIIREPSPLFVHHREFPTILLEYEVVITLKVQV